MELLKTDIHDMISSMQASISSQLADIASSVASLEERVTAVEELATITASSSGTQEEMTTPTRPTKRGRKRRTPLQIHVGT